jgi:hypothetical protein
MSRAHAEAEGLTLLEADTNTGVYLDQRGMPKPYHAQVRRGGKSVSLGTFATAEEAALCVARSPEGRAAAERAAAPPQPRRSEEARQQARQQARAEGLTLRKADNKTGYFGVKSIHPGKPKPYQARVTRDGKVVHLGSFATAEEAALCVARSPEGQAAAKRPAAAPPLTSEEARQQARAEGLTLLKADTKAGYFGVHVDPRAKTKPYEARVWRGGKQVNLGTFATAEEAALCVARTPEGRAAAAEQAAAKRAAPAPQPPASEEGQGTAPAMPPGAVLKEEGAVPPMPPGAFVKEEGVVPPMPPGAFVEEEQVAPPGALIKEEGVVPPMPPDVAVKQEREVVVKQERSQDGRGAKRQRQADQ